MTLWLWLFGILNGWPKHNRHGEGKQTSEPV